MRRRKFIALLGSAASWPLAARAQQPQRMRQISVLMAFVGPVAQSEFKAFQGSLTKLGWAEGSNLRTEVRWGAGDADKIRSFAKELVDTRPDVIIGHSTPVVAALVRETRTIPIVFINVADPIGSGFVTSLSRPDGNLTGFTTDNSELGGKWVELLKAIAPSTMRVALLFNPATVVPLKTYMPSIRAAASSLAIQVDAAPVHAKHEIEVVIAALAGDARSGLIVMPDPFNATNREQIIQLAAAYRVPAIYYTRTNYSESGGLIE